MLYKPSKNLTFIVYEDQESPKCYKIKKSHLKFIFVSVPVLLGLSLLFLVFGTTYFKTIEEAKKQEIPAIITDLKEKLAQTEEQNKQLTEIENELTQKLTQTTAPTNAITPTFATIAGMSDRTNKKLVSLESVSTKVAKEEIEFTFTVVKTNYDGEKISGYIFVTQKYLGSRNLYPIPKIEQEDKLIQFNQGEFFSIRRGRPPTAISFPRPKVTQGQLFYEVIIFSRTGDLLLKEKFGPIANKVN